MVKTEINVIKKINSKKAENNRKIISCKMQSNFRNVLMLKHKIKSQKVKYTNNSTSINEINTYLHTANNKTNF